MTPVALGPDRLQNVLQPLALRVGQPAADAERLRVRHVDQEPARQADLLREPGALAADRVLGDLNDDVLPGLQDLLDATWRLPVDLFVVGHLARVQDRVAPAADVDERGLHAGQDVLHLAQVDVADHRPGAGAGDVVLDQHAVLEHRDLIALLQLGDEHRLVRGAAHDRRGLAAAAAGKPATAGAGRFGGTGLALRLGRAASAAAGAGRRGGGGARRGGAAGGLAGWPLLRGRLPCGLARGGGCARPPPAAARLLLASGIRGRVGGRRGSAPRFPRPWLPCPVRPRRRRRRPTRPRGWHGLGRGPLAACGGGVWRRPAPLRACHRRRSRSASSAVSFGAGARRVRGLVVEPASAGFAASSVAFAVSAAASLDVAAALVPPARERRRRAGVFGAAPFGPSPSVAGVPAPSFRAGVAAGVSPFAVSVSVPCVAVPVPGRLRPRPPRRRRLRAGAAEPPPSAPGGSDDVLPAACAGATADSIPASLTKRSFLSGHAGIAGHARTQR